MPYFAYIVGGWVQKEGKSCLRNKSMAPYQNLEKSSIGDKNSDSLLIKKWKDPISSIFPKANQPFAQKI